MKNKCGIILGIALLAMGLVRPVSADSIKPVAVLLSSDDKAYSRPVAAFTEEFKRPVVVFSLHGEVGSAEKRMSDVLSRDPAMIFALGAKAAYIAKLETLKRHRQDVPIIFAMVLNWERYELLRGSDNIAGIAADIDPGTQFANLAMFAPQVKKIGVIYSKIHSLKIIAKARQVAQELGYELIARPINRQKEFRQAFDKMADDIQAYWILADPVVFSTRNMERLKKRCLKKNIITIGQSENIVKLGMLLGINTDARNIGLQAASMAKDILLFNQSPKDIGVMPPLGTTLVLNIKTAEKIGLKINELALDMTSKIVE